MDLTRARLLYRKYYPDIRRVFMALMVSVATYVFAAVRSEATRPVDAVVVGMLAAVITLLIWLSFSMRRHVSWKIRRLESIVDEVWGATGHQTVYSRRVSHFSEEKQLLAGYVIKTLLPQLIKQAADSERENCRLAIVIDSGTTLSPVFTQLRLYGFARTNVDVASSIHVYTNNLAGIQQFYSGERIAAHPVETNLHLLGGNPLEDYRATTGEETLADLDRLFARRKARELTGVIGILTANWILTGRAGQSLIICARGRGHYQFKQKLTDICDIVVVVAPLGKLLRLESVHSLNALIHDGRTYEGFELTGTRESRFLLTTRRTKVESLLYHHWKHLDDMQPAKAYTLVSDLPLYDPVGNQEELEIPHDYVRPYARQLFWLE